MVSVLLPPPCATPARRAAKSRRAARIEGALSAQPALEVDRLGPALRLLRTYREGHVGGLALRLAEVEREVGALEAWAADQGRRHHRDGATIRRALTFLWSFGRISALDFSLVPIEERGDLVRWLALEYRWCFAAAGTTPRAFKVAIGRTGAR